MFTLTFDQISAHTLAGAQFPHSRQISEEWGIDVSRQHLLALPP
jgi:hypothetical protein